MLRGFQPAPDGFPASTIAVVMAAWLIFTAGLSAVNVGSVPENEAFRLRFGFGLTAGAAAGSGPGAFAFAGAFTFAGAGAGALTFAGAGAGALTFVGTGVGVGVGVGAFSSTVEDVFSASPPCSALIGACRDNGVSAGCSMIDASSNAGFVIVAASLEGAAIGVSSLLTAAAVCVGFAEAAARGGGGAVAAFFFGAGAAEVPEEAGLLLVPLLVPAAEFGGLRFFAVADADPLNFGIPVLVFSISSFISLPPCATATNFKAQLNSSSFSTPFALAPVADRFHISRSAFFKIKGEGGDNYSGGKEGCVPASSAPLRAE